ncbi:hypothetical protein PJP07_31380, partial [Mycobacterium kansasii]
TLVTQLAEYIVFRLKQEKLQFCSKKTSCGQLAFLGYIQMSRRAGFHSTQVDIHNISNMT